MYMFSNTHADLSKHQRVHACTAVQQVGFSLGEKTTSETPMQGLSVCFVDIGVQVFLVSLRTTPVSHIFDRWVCVCVCVCVCEGIRTRVHGGSFMSVEKMDTPGLHFLCEHFTKMSLTSCSITFLKIPFSFATENRNSTHVPHLFSSKSACRFFYK